MNNVWKTVAAILALALAAVVMKERYIPRVFSALSSGMTTAQSRVWDTEYWIQKEKYFRQLDCSGKIVFLGTSLVAEADWNELMKRTDICNRGIGGDVTAGIQKRIDVYINQHPKVIFLKAGVNDFFWKIPMDSVKKNYEAIIHRIRDRSVPLYIMTTNFTSDQFADYSRINNEVTKLNSFLKETCLQNNIPFIDINAGLLKDGKLDNAFTYDGIHLNGDGYFRVADVLQPYLVQY